MRNPETFDLRSFVVHEKTETYVHILLCEDENARFKFPMRFKNVLMEGHVLVYVALFEVKCSAYRDCKDVAFSSSKFVIIHSLHR
jgi:hypothetical protein